MGARARITFNVGPPVLWRTSRRWLAIAIVCFVLALGLAVWRYSRAPKLLAWQRYTILVLGLMPTLVCYPIYAKLERRVRGNWQQSGGRLCMHCGYMLIGLPPRGRCPECGSSYDLDADLKHWRVVGFDRPALHATEAPNTESRH